MSNNIGPKEPTKSLESMLEDAGATIVGVTSSHNIENHTSLSNSHVCSECFNDAQEKENKSNVQKMQIAIGSNERDELDEFLVTFYYLMHTDITLQEDRGVLATVHGSDTFKNAKQGLKALLQKAEQRGRISEQMAWVLPNVEDAHEHEQSNSGSGIQYFDNSRLGRLRELKAQEDEQ